MSEYLSNEGEFDAFKRGLSAALRIVKRNHPLATGAIASIQRLVDAMPPSAICRACGRTWEDFQKTTTCDKGGCPWGGDF